MKYISLLLIICLFTSCTDAIAGWGIAGIIAVFAIMLILFATMFFLIARRKKKGEKSLVKFNNDIYLALKKLDTPQQKINMLNKLIERINNDEKYQKDTEWRDKVLMKVYMHLATVYYHAGDEVQTLNVCNNIVTLDPNDGMIYYNRGSIFSNMGMYEKALQDLNMTVELLPTYASGYNNRGLVHEKMEHYPEALADFNQAIKLEGSPVAYYNRGNTYFETGDYRKALEDYRTVLDLVRDTDSDLKNEVELSIKVTEEKLNLPS